MQGITVAVLLCAGQGSRMGLGHNKIFLPLAGEPLILHTLRIFERNKAIDEILLVAHPQEIEDMRRVVNSHAQKLSNIVAGGSSRHQSEYQAIVHLRPRILTRQISTILLHDGARPCVTQQELTDIIRASRRHSAAILASSIPAYEQIAEVNAQREITVLLQSNNLWRAQTPQSFDATLLLDAYQQAQQDNFEGTDTASSIERLGHPVIVMHGSDSNIKVTTPDDIIVAERFLNEQNV